MGCWYPKWYVYHLWIDSSNGICTTLWTILLKLRVVYIPVTELTSWWYPKGIYITFFWLILAMVYIPLYERILFQLRVVYIPETELESWWYPKGIYTNFGLILAMVYVPLYERILFNTPTNHSHTQPRSTPNLVNYFLRNVFRYNIRMVFCHIKVAPFAHETISYIGIYFPRNFTTTAENVIVVEAIKYLGKYMTICLILACEKEAIYMWQYSILIFYINTF